MSVSLRHCQFREDRRISHSFMALYGTKSSFMVLHVPSSNAMWTFTYHPYHFDVFKSRGYLDLCFEIFCDQTLQIHSFTLLIESEIFTSRISRRLNSDHMPDFVFRASTCVGKSLLIACDDRAYPLYGNFGYTNDHIRSRIWWSESPILWQIERCHYHYPAQP
jgi:hypothetical protein